MKIFNVRYGFATNSSSSHSIVRLRKNKRIPFAIDSAYDQSFCGQHFLLTSKLQKLTYLACQFQSHLVKHGPYSDLCHLFESVELQGTACIDHNSMFDLDRKGKDFIQFQKDAVKYILDNDDIFIIGGQTYVDIPKVYLRAFDTSLTLSELLYHSYNYEFRYDKNADCYFILEKSSCAAKEKMFKFEK